MCPTSQYYLHHCKAYHCGQRANLKAHNTDVLPVTMASSSPKSAPNNGTCPDNSFGPFAGYHCRGGFDFTLLFEEAIMTIPLQCILLLVLPFRVKSLLKSEAKVGWGLIRPLKLVCYMLSPTGRFIWMHRLTVADILSPYPR